MLFLTACSGGDDSPAPVQNTDTTQLLGKWKIYKAEYENSEPVLYESNGACGREILEFQNDGEVSETLYIDDDCQFGGSGSYSWWVLENGAVAMGAQNSYHHIITVNGNELMVDATQEAGYKKYYNKLN
ncbi:hypothetical protein DVK85_06140 [Flavobacterium arcticum]|uniref:Lipocalin-like domain-containing protein n=2 Tax=Flavobacterium arcticum TaxID=1784713 RepID=A0A345HB79_9FLAO|nr:hypothetical protein DVK85_06140 [Flavobacterium arcticum]